MAKRSANAHFLPMPVAKRETAAHPLILANRKVSELQQKVVQLQAELDTCKKANDNKGLNYARAEVNALKIVVQKLTTENENLAKTANKQQQPSHSQQQRINELEEQLGRTRWEKGEMEKKFQAENQARAQLITKLSTANEVNHSLAQQLQQASCRSVDSHDAKKVHEANRELQHRIDHLYQENSHLKRELSRGGGGQSQDSAQLGHALNESKRHCSMLNDEKNRLTMELNITRENGEKAKAQLERSEFMNKMMSDQLDIFKKNSEMWQEQSKNLSEHLKRSGGMGMVPPPQFYPPPSQLPPSTAAASTHAAIPQTPSLYHRHSSTPSQASDVITLDDDDFSKVKKEDAF